MSQHRVLVIDIDPVIRSGICGFLVDQGFSVCDASNITDAQRLLERFRPDAVVLDVYLPNGDVPLLLQRAKSMEPRIPVLLLVGRIGSSLGLRTSPGEADEVLTKPVEMSELHNVLLRVLKGPRAKRSPGLPSQTESLDPFLGQSAVILRLHELALRVLQMQSPVLIQGETGTGKGVLAKWIHENSPRAKQQFLDVNCAGLSRELLDSELFGYQKGAFTSAVSPKQGLLEVAHGGTVFLDEIGDMDWQVQSKLLKVLEERRFRRLGDVRDRAVDIRLISATHRNLSDLVREQKFRKDLYYRVNILTLQVPPLRQRLEDLPILSEHLLRSITQHLGKPQMRLAGSAMFELERYPWPGNIRELRNVLERAALAAGSNVLRSEHLHFQTSSNPETFAASESNGTLKDVERAYINHVLQAEGGSVERAARRLGIPRSSLYNKMRRFEIAQGTGRLGSELPLPDDAVR